MDGIVLDRRQRAMVRVVTLLIASTATSSSSVSNFFGIISVASFSVTTAAVETEQKNSDNDWCSCSACPFVPLRRSRRGLRHHM